MSVPAVHVIWDVRCHPINNKVISCLYQSLTSSYGNISTLHAFSYDQPSLTALQSEVPSFLYKHIHSDDKSFISDLLTHLIWIITTTSVSTVSSGLVIISDNVELIHAANMASKIFVPLVHVHSSFFPQTSRCCHSYAWEDLVAVYNKQQKQNPKQDEIISYDTFVLNTFRYIIHSFEHDQLKPYERYYKTRLGALLKSHVEAHKHWKRYLQVLIDHQEICIISENDDNRVIWPINKSSSHHKAQPRYFLVADPLNANIQNISQRVLLDTFRYFHVPRVFDFSITPVKKNSRFGMAHILQMHGPPSVRNMRLGPILELIQVLVHYHVLHVQRSNGHVSIEPSFAQLPHHTLSNYFDTIMLQQEQQTQPKKFHHGSTDYINLLQAFDNATLTNNDNNDDKDDNDADFNIFAYPFPLHSITFPSSISVSSNK